MTGGRAPLRCQVQEGSLRVLWNQPVLGQLVKCEVDTECAHAKLQCSKRFAVPKTSHRINRRKAGLVVVDIQERLLPAIFEKERVVQNAVRLIRAAQVLSVPVLATEQYRKGLGATVAEVAAAMAGFAPLEKLTFSSCGAPAFAKALQAHGVKDVILCGIEAHVCVQQTAIDLMKDYFVYVVADAIGSRHRHDHKVAVERLRDCGAVITTVESAVFELLRQAGTDQFKQVLPLFK